MTIKTPQKQYRIFPAYINYDGFVIPEGIYGETEIDVIEARLKSTVVLVNASEVGETKPTNTSLDIQLSPTTDISFQNTSSVATIKKLKINTCTASEIEALKFVGKVAAQKITESRRDAKIESYAQLDRIAPLKGGKKWEDIAVIDFELPDPTHGLVYEGLKTFGYTAETTNVQSTPTK